MSKKKSKPIASIGKNVPSNFKFGIIVAVAIFWADFIESLLDLISDLLGFNLHAAWLNLFTAVLVTVVGVITLETYSYVRGRLKKIKVPKDK